MINLLFNTDKNKGLDILFLGAHCDDIEIGCGGTLLKLKKQYAIKSITWVVFTSSKLRKKEAIVGAENFIGNDIEKKIIVLGYKDAFLDQSRYEIKDFFESLKKMIHPDIVFTHYRKDRHQDHRLISDLTWNTFRNHLVLEYEIPKYDGDLGKPNVFFTLTEELANTKVDIITKSYKSQASKHWFDSESFYAIMRIRAIESANVNKYSEAFYLRKAVF